MPTYTGRAYGRKHSKAAVRAAAKRVKNRYRKGKRHEYADYDYRHDVPAEESRRRRRRGRRHHGRRRNPLPNPLANPISGAGEFFMGAFGAMFGYVVAGAADRWAATHALTGTTGALQDQPGPGQIYNSESIDLPIWSSVMRLGVAAGAVVAPLVLSEMVAAGPMRAFLQVAGFAALARTVGKAAEDFIAKSLPSNKMVQQLYAPEQAAANRLSQATGQTLPSAAPNTFAGMPRRMVGAAPQRPALPGGRQSVRQPAQQQQQQVRRIGDISSAGIPWQASNGRWYTTDSGGISYPLEKFYGHWLVAVNGAWQPWNGSTPGGSSMPPLVTDAGAGADMPSLSSYNPYSACGNCDDAPVAAMQPGGSIFPQPPGCDPLASQGNLLAVQLGPNGPTPPQNCQPPISSPGVTPPVPTSTQLPTAPLPPPPVIAPPMSPQPTSPVPMPPVVPPAPPVMVRGGGSPGPATPAPPLYVTPR